jgi:hypothetical protein
MVGTLQQIADYVRELFYADSFGLSARRLDFVPGDLISYNTSAVNTNTAFQVIESLKITKAYTGFDFQSTTAAGAVFTFREDDVGFYAAQYVADGKIGRVEINLSPNFAGGEAGIGNRRFQFTLHEVAHGLGLGHAGPYNFSGSYDTDAVFSNDSWFTTIMSYFTQSQAGAPATYSNPQTLQAADLVAIEDIYGFYAAFTGDTVWGANTNISSDISAVLANMSRLLSTSAFTIKDDGGTDTIDLSNFTVNQRLDLRGTSKDSSDLKASNAGGEIGNLVLAPGTVIENGITGSGNDVLIGNAVSNRLSGGSGNDTLTGGEGADVFQYTAGNDLITDYNLTDDQLDLPSGADLTYADSEQGVVITVGVLGSITLTGRVKSDFVTEPAPEPTPAPEPEPTPAPEPEPTPAPEPEPTPAPEPEPTPAPEPEPTPAPEPEPTPAPEPEPTPAPEPEPTPAPEPEPTPAPEPEPTPAPEPEPTPARIPTSKSIPAPASVPFSEPEPIPKPDISPNPEHQPQQTPAPVSKPQVDVVAPFEPTPEPSLQPSTPDQSAINPEPPPSKAPTPIPLNEDPVVNPPLLVPQHEILPETTSKTPLIEPSDFSDFTRKDLRKTSVAMYRLFGADHIMGLPAKSMKGLSKKHVLNTSVEQMSYFSDAQLRFVKGKRYKVLSPDQFTVIEPLLPSLKANQLRHLPDYSITQEVIELMSYKQLSALDLYPHN